MATRTLLLAAIALIVEKHGLADELGPYLHPFSIPPKKEVIHVSSEQEVSKWKYHFRSVDEFIDAVRQPSFKVLASGKTDVAYYAVFRTSNVLLGAWSFIGEEKTNASSGVSPLKGDDPVLREEPVDLLDTTILLDANSPHPPAGQIFTASASCQLSGYAATIRPDYVGPIRFFYQLWNQGRDKVRSGGTITVQWTPR